MAQKLAPADTYEHSRGTRAAYLEDAAERKPLEASQPDVPRHCRRHGGAMVMNCTRCHNGPIEFIYRINWSDIHYCPHCNLEHTVDIRRATELIDKNTREIERFGE